MCVRRCNWLGQARVAFIQLFSRARCVPPADLVGAQLYAELRKFPLMALGYAHLIVDYDNCLVFSVRSTVNRWPVVYTVSRFSRSKYSSPALFGRSGGIVWEINTDSRDVTVISKRWTLFLVTFWLRLHKYLISSFGVVWWERAENCWT